MLKTPGLLGTRGLIFESPNAYSIYSEIGVYSPNEETKVVDIVGHSWFFKRSWLTQFWLALEDRFEEDLAGEDIHFSYVLQKFLKIPTLVPPHPIAEPSLWGSIPVLAKKMGSGEESISRSEESLRRFENALQHYRNLGFKTIAEVQGTPARYPQIVYKSIRRFPLLTHEFSRIARRFRKD
jgi:hypothetical protein